MDENELQRTVEALLRARPSLLWHHCGRPFACRGGAGWPDLVVIGPQRLILRELKGDATRVRRHQQAYGHAIIAAGVSWALWRPADLASGLIVAELDSLLPVPRAAA